MTFDKLIAVCFPLKAATWCTKRRAKISAVLILLTWIGLDTHIVFVEADEEAIRARLIEATCRSKITYRHYVYHLEDLDVMDPNGRCGYT
jgi:hypothetical protein